MDHNIQQAFIHLLADHNLKLNDAQLQQFEDYYRLLVDWNERMNLTAITERSDVYIKHFYDSLSPAFYGLDLLSIRTMADIGAGAGFPSIPLKILFPHLQLTIIDSLKKRITFLESLIVALKLSDVTCVHGRAEDVARFLSHRDHYDFVTARAVARLPLLNELCLPFVRTNGLFMALKGSDYAQEIEESHRSLQLLRGKIENVQLFHLPKEQAVRANIFIRKQGTTPNLYPRKAGVPSKQPLI